MNARATYVPASGRIYVACDRGTFVHIPGRGTYRTTWPVIGAAMWTASDHATPAQLINRAASILRGMGYPVTLQPSTHD